mgnify:CR=1 FL=1
MIPFFKNPLLKSMEVRGVTKFMKSSWRNVTLFLRPFVLMWMHYLIIGLYTLYFNQWYTLMWYWFYIGGGSKIRQEAEQVEVAGENWEGVTNFIHLSHWPHPLLLHPVYHFHDSRRMDVCWISLLFIHFAHNDWLWRLCCWLVIIVSSD